MRTGVKKYGCQGGRIKSGLLVFYFFQHTFVLRKRHAYPLTRRMENGYQHTQPPAVLSPSSHLHHNKDDDRNDEKYQEKPGIKAGAENIADELASGHSDHQHEK